MKSDKSIKWGLACDKEIVMLLHMKVWNEVDLPNGKRVVLSKWVFNLKDKLRRCRD